MRHTLLILIASALGAAASHADDADRRVRQNPFIPGQYDIYEDGTRVGTARQNPFIPGEIDLRDADGQRTGTLRQNPFIPGEHDLEPAD